jgi:hypothetical protein
MHGKRIATHIALANQLSLSTNWLARRAGPQVRGAASAAPRVPVTLSALRYESIGCTQLHKMLGSEYCLARAERLRILMLTAVPRVSQSTLLDQAAVARGMRFGTNHRRVGISALSPGTPTSSKADDPGVIPCAR